MPTRTKEPSTPELDVPDEQVLETILGRELFEEFFCQRAALLGFEPGRPPPRWKALSEEMRGVWRAVARRAVLVIEELAEEAGKED
jgi:hypothetical protein